MESDFEIQCPYCGELIWMEFFPEDGRKQELVVDCEVCCNPIQYNVQFKNTGETNLQVERAQ